MTTVPPATVSPLPDFAVDLREYRPSGSTPDDLHFAVRFEGIQQSVAKQEVGRVPLARYEQQLQPVPTPPARRLENPPVRLGTGESLQVGVQRLSLVHLDHAIAVLESGYLSPDEATHEPRKAVRWVRGLLRLVRDELGPKIYRFENLYLRDTGRRISEARNAAVALDTPQRSRAGTASCSLRTSSLVS